jgi:hypothetical protein
MSTKPLPPPTTTTLVKETLGDGTVLLSEGEICDHTGRKPNQVNAALWHLVRVHAVVRLDDEDGTAYYYGTPERDERTRIIDNRYPEETPRDILPGSRKLSRRRARLQRARQLGGGPHE